MPQLLVLRELEPLVLLVLLVLHGVCGQAPVVVHAVWSLHMLLLDWQVHDDAVGQLALQAIPLLGVPSSEL